MKKLWYFGFFLLSGFCSLVYETVWLRLVMAKFGVTTPMVSIVLSVFMAGLALGSWSGGVLARRLERSGPAAPLRFYGLIELIIGLSGLLVPLLINIGYGMLMNGRSQLAWNSSLYYVASGGWVAMSLLPWCTCMGATFPLAMAAIRKTSSAGSEHSFSYLYLSNVLGAILGTLIPTFFLVELLGFQGTLLVASSLNGILAITVFALSFGQLSSAEETSAPVPEKTAPAKLYNLPADTTFWLLLVTGVCSMAIEVVWFRLFTLFLGNFVYSFSVVLALYLGATYAGSQVYRWWVRSHDPMESATAWIFLGTAALMALPFADPTLPLPATPLWIMGRIVLGVTPFSAMLGFLTPMLVDHYSQGDPDRAGRAYAVNVLGSIVGPLLSGFWILPWLGEHGGLIALAIPLFAVGLLVAFRPIPVQTNGCFRYKDRLLYAVVVLVSIPLAAITRTYETTYPDRVELRDYMGTVIATGAGMNRALVVNGFGMTALTPITKFMAHLPLASMSRPPRNGLVICFGMGTTFRSMLSWGIDSTAVDLVPSVPKLFGYYHPDGPQLVKSPLAHVVIDDGRRFLERSAELYDVITVDPPPPVNAPTSSLLYSREFYSIVSKHLRPGGIVQVWIFTEGSRWDPAFPASAVKAVRDSFPYTQAYLSLNGWGLHLLASNDPIPKRDARELASRLSPKAAEDFVEWGPGSNTEEMFNSILGQPVAVDKVVEMDSRVPALRDDEPINEYFFLRMLIHYYR